MKLRLFLYILTDQWSTLCEVVYLWFGAALLCLFTIVDSVIVCVDITCRSIQVIICQKPRSLRSGYEVSVKWRQPSCDGRVMILTRLQFCSVSSELSGQLLAAWQVSSPRVEGSKDWSTVCWHVHVDQPCCARLLRVYVDMLIYILVDWILLFRASCFKRLKENLIKWKVNIAFRKTFVW